MVVIKEQINTQNNSQNKLINDIDQLAKELGKYYLCSN